MAEPGRKGSKGSGGKKIGVPDLAAKRKGPPGGLKTRHDGPTDPLRLGDTGTHEVGHWVG